MSEYIYKIGDDYECNNKEYVVLPTDKGQQITVAFIVSGVPFKGRWSNINKVDRKKWRTR